MAERRSYSAADLTVVSWDEAVRRRPAMWFGVDRQDPDLPTRILIAVVRDALHLPDGRHRKASAEITGELRFTVADDRPPVHGGRDAAAVDGALIDRRRWTQSAAVALSRRTVIEVWSGGRGLRQELAGGRPVAPPRAIGAPVAEDGMRVTYELDREYLPPGAAIARPAEVSDLHGEWCAGEAPAAAVIVDARPGGPGPRR